MSTRALVLRPDGSSGAALSVDMAACFGWAMQEEMAAALLRPHGHVNEALFSLAPTDGVRRLQPRGLRGAWWGLRWRLSRARRRASARAMAARASFWREVYRELRRHVADGRLPHPLRSRLRDKAKRALSRSRTLDREPHDSGLPRQWLRRPVPVAQPDAQAAEMRILASSVGLDPDRPMVALDMRVGLERLRAVVDALSADGYQIVRIGTADEPSSVADIDLTADARRTAALEVYVLLHARFIVSTDPTTQLVAYLTNTPCLTLDAVDPITAYPVRVDGVYLLATAIDLQSGEPLSPADVLSPRYLRNPSRFGHRLNTPVDILMAVKEMRDGLDRGWHDSESQSRFRALVREGALAAAADVPRVSTWGPDGGFIGDGRLARVQADRWL